MLKFPRNLNSFGMMIPVTVRCDLEIVATLKSLPETCWFLTFFWQLFYDIIIKIDMLELSWRFQTQTMFYDSYDNLVQSMLKIRRGLSVSNCKSPITIC